MTASTSNPVLIYDGQCHFCIQQMERLKRMDRENRLEYIPRQDPDADQRFPVLQRIDFNSGMRLIMPDGSLYSGADAFYQIAQILPQTRAIAWMYNIPGVKQIARGVYAWIAKNRQRLGKS